MVDTGSVIDFNTVYSLLTVVVTTIGLWHIFKKCQIDKRWALVPFVRSYKLAECAEAESDGRGLLISEILFTVGDYSYKILRLIQKKSETHLDVYGYVYIALILAFGIAQLVYSIRVYSALSDRFGRKKLWIVLWLGLESVASLIWGLSSRFVVQEEEEDDGNTIEGIDGLTLRGADGVLNVDIKSRTVRDFFKKKTLLEDIKLTISPGTMVLLLGGSGAGKTTFVNAVIGYEKADAVVTLGKKNIYKEFSTMMYDIGFVPQMDLIRYNDTVIRTIEDASLLKMSKDVTKEERMEKINNTLEIFGLKSQQNTLISKLSGGQKKRTSIATEFVADPSLFILDEPDSGLDGVLARDLMERLRAISRKGKIVIVITHSPDRVIDFFDEVVILAKDNNKIGRLVFSGKIDDAKSFFGCDNMEEIIKKINRREEGGEGKADELIRAFEEMRQNA